MFVDFNLIWSGFVVIFICFWYMLLLIVFENFGFGFLSVLGFLNEREFRGFLWFVFFGNGRFNEFYFSFFLY